MTIAAPAAVAAPVAPAAAPIAPAPVVAPQTGASIQAKIAAEQQKREVANLRKELEATKAQAAEGSALKAWRDGLRTNPDGLKEVLGDKWYDVITDTQLNGGRLTPEQVDAKLDAKLRERDEKAAAEQAKADEARATAKSEERTAWVKDLTEFVTADAAKYRLINMHASHESVATIIEKQYRETGKLMTDAEGADMLEGNIRKAVLDSLTPDLVAEWTKGRTSQASTSRAAPQFSVHNGQAAATPAPGPKPMLTREQRRAAAFQKFDEQHAPKG